MVQPVVISELSGSRRSGNAKRRRGGAAKARARGKKKQREKGKGHLGEGEEVLHGALRVIPSLGGDQEVAGASSAMQELRPEEEDNRDFSHRQVPGFFTNRSLGF